MGWIFIYMCCFSCTCVCLWKIDGNFTYQLCSSVKSLFIMYWYYSCACFYGVVLFSVLSRQLYPSVHVECRGITLYSLIWCWLTWLKVMPKTMDFSFLNISLPNLYDRWFNKKMFTCMLWRLRILKLTLLNIKSAQV